MKTIGTLVALLFISGCVSSGYGYTRGREFDTDQVDQIKKGETTTAEITEWFGEPWQKSAVSEAEEKWIYWHVVGRASATGFLVRIGRAEDTTTTLDLVIRDGVVTHFTFDESKEERKL